MTAAIVLSVVVPSVAGLIFLALRSGYLRAPADVRGIALQTVIIMVVLLAVAGAVAGVLLARGGEAVSEGRATGHHARSRRILQRASVRRVRIHVGCRYLL